MKIGGQMLWNVTPICEASQIYCLMGRRPVRGDSECHVKDQIVPFVAMVEYHPITANDLSRLHQFGKKVLPGISLTMYCTRVEFGKETFWSQTLRNWKRSTHLNPCEKTQCKGSVNAHEW